MRISCHSHVFNFKSIFTPRSLQILSNRLHDEQLPGFLRDRLMSVLSEWLEAGGEALSGERLAHTLLERVTGSDQFREFLNTLGSNDRLKLEILNSDTVVKRLGTLGIADLLESVTRSSDGFQEDAEKRSLEDFLYFLYIGLQPSIDAVTDYLLQQLEEQDVTVPLTLDITEGGDDDRKLYTQQLRDTSRQILRHPGRVLPFVCVNTRRDDHFDIMERALTAQGFVGVKLYPSLGYSVVSDEMHRVYAYCAERSVPLLMHCSRGGFYASEQDKEFCDPAHWEDILERHEGLKICLAHLGGGGHLVDDEIEDGTWAAKIIELMHRFPGVYTDIAHHTSQMGSPEKEANYFRNMGTLFADATTRRRVLFGTDYYVVRRVLTAGHFWRYYEEGLDAGIFELMTVMNPSEFLGLRSPDGGGLTWNMVNHVDFVAERADECDSLPARWLASAVEERHGASVRFTASPLGPRWSRNNKVHKLVYDVMRQQMVDADQDDHDFASGGTLQLRRLQYWNKEFEAPDIFERKCAFMGRSLDRSFTKKGAKYEEGMRKKDAVKTLTGAFADGSLRLTNLGVLCDSLYEFPEDDE